MKGKGYIQYAYDNQGTKLEKVVFDSLSRHAATTLYVGGFVYQQTDTITTPTAGIDTLQYMAHEEGRARWAFHKFTTATTAYGWEYDFMEKDHLGNTRILLSQQKDTAKYVATMEAAYRNTENALFYNIPNTNVARTAAPGYPVDTTVTSPNDSVAKVNGSGQKVGPGIILKVMSGDKVDVAVQYYYNSPGTAGSNLSSSDLLNSLASGIVSLTGGAHGSLSDLTGAGNPLTAALTSFLGTNNPTQSLKPSAYLNWILLDNQFNYVGSYPQSGALPVGSYGTAGGILQTPLSYKGIPITKSGYLYIYVSNATPGWDVFFDNLTVKTYSGPMLEENHYYPFGLTMAGISDKAVKTQYAENKDRYNDGSELQNKEFSDGSGLELYDADFRGYDPEIGRFCQLDPMADVDPGWSLYSFAYNNPVLFNDPLGLEPESEASLPAHVPPPLPKPVCLTCALPKPDPSKNIPAPPSNVPAPIQPDQHSWLYHVWNDHNKVTDFAYEINKWNPLANAINAVDTYITGHDTYDVKQTKTQAIVQLASVASISKAAIGLSILERTIMEEGISVLGSYPGYVTLADQLAAQRFSIPINIWNTMTAEQQWAANIKFLDRVISRGDKIVLSNSAFNAKAGTAFYRELQYLFSKGYKVASDGLSLIK